MAGAQAGKNAGNTGTFKVRIFPFAFLAVAFSSLIPMRQLGKAWVWKDQVVPEPYVAFRSIDQDIDITIYNDHLMATSC